MKKLGDSAPLSLTWERSEALRRLRGQGGRLRSDRLPEFPHPASVFGVPFSAVKETSRVQNKTVPVVSSLAQLRGVKAVLCYGSYAMGLLDGYSDLDLYVFCEPEIVSPLDRQSTFDSINGMADVQLNFVLAGWETQWCPQNDRFRLEDSRFDIAYNTTEWVRTVVRRVTEEGVTSIPEMRFRPYTMLGLLANSIILHDPELFLSKLLTRLYPYPSGLKKTLIFENLPFLREGLEELRDCTQRGIGNSAFLFHLHRIIDALSTILFALNEKYDPATKRLEQVYKRLSILPSHFLERYTRLLEGPFDTKGRQKTVKECEIIVQEIECLVHQ